MSPLPSWLPVMFIVNPWTSGTFDDLYTIFRTDLIIYPVNYNGFNVWFFPEMEDGKEKIFWHLTTRVDIVTGDRFPDLPRCERLPWARPIINNCNDQEVLSWDYIEGDGVTHTYVWLNNHDYVIIMKKYTDDSRRLLTAFWVEYPNTKRKLLKKFKQRTT